jgi:hypothetical protein
VNLATVLKDFSSDYFALSLAAPRVKFTNALIVNSAFVLALDNLIFKYPFM